MASLTVNAQKFQVEELKAEGSKRVIQVDGKRVQTEIMKELSRNPLELLIKVESRVLHVTVEKMDEGELFSVRLNGKPLQVSLALFEELHSSRDLAGGDEGPATVTAPMAGRIASLEVALGTVVEKGQALFVLEAMKMENEVASPKKGLVKEIYVQAGALVKAGDKLAFVD